MSNEVIADGSLEKYRALECCPCCGNNDRFKIMHWIEPTRDWHTLECLVCKWATGRNSTLIQAIGEWNYEDAQERTPKVAHDRDLLQSDNARLRAALIRIRPIARELREGGYDNRSITVLWNEVSAALEPEQTTSEGK